MRATLFPDDDDYPRKLYGGTPPHEDVDTSAAAAASMRPHATRLARHVLYHVGLFRDGVTCEELERRTGLSHQSCSARVRELVLLGRIEPCGKRKGTSGRMQRTYRVVQP